MLLNAKKFILCVLILWGGLIAGSFLLYSINEKAVFSSPKNPRTYTSDRSSILDAFGEPLAYDKPGHGRIYPLGPSAAHVIGFADRHAGPGGGIEMKHASRLIKKEKLFYFYEPKDIPLKSTLHAPLQKTLDMAIGKKGAAVVMNADTGDILALVSHPTYDPNKIGKEWKPFPKDKGEVLFNKVQGSYPPGSVWKIIPSLLLQEDAPFYCTGELKAGNKVVHCPHRHGEVTGIKDAFARSCNLYFIKRSMAELDQEEFLKLSSSFTSGNLPKHMTEFEFAIASIGQGKVAMTPMDGAKLAATIVSGGFMPSPRYTDEEDILKKRVLEPQEAYRVRELMKAVVVQGTGQSLKEHPLVKSGEVVVGLKTGTAQKADRGDIGWVVGFAEQGENKIAFAVVSEDLAEGSFAAQVCLPVVSRLLTTYFKKRGQ